MLSALAASSTSTGILMAIGGVIAVLAISAVFYVVGRGEDREREQAAHARAAAAQEQPEPPAAAPPAAAPPDHEERRARLRGDARSRRRR